MIKNVGKMRSDFHQNQSALNFNDVYVCENVDQNLGNSKSEN